MWSGSPAACSAGLVSRMSMRSCMWNRIQRAMAAISSPGARRQVAPAIQTSGSRYDDVAEDAAARLHVRAGRGRLPPPPGIGRRRQRDRGVLAGDLDARDVAAERAALVGDAELERLAAGSRCRRRASPRTSRRRARSPTRCRSGRPRPGSRRRRGARQCSQARVPPSRPSVLGEAQPAGREQEPGREADAEVAAEPDRQRRRQHRGCAGRARGPGSGSARRWFGDSGIGDPLQIRLFCPCHGHVQARSQRVTFHPH